MNIIVKEMKTRSFISDDEAEGIVKEYTEGYMSDGFNEMEARSMAIIDFAYEYEE